MGGVGSEVWGVGCEGWEGGVGTLIVSGRCGVWGVRCGV